MRFTLYVPKASCPKGMKEDTCPLRKRFKKEEGIKFYKYAHSPVTKRPVYKIVGDFTNKLSEAKAFNIVLETCNKCHKDHNNQGR